MAKSFLLLALGLSVSACFEGKIVTTKVRKGAKLNGVVYTLPKTVVKTDVPIDREDKTPGKFAAFTPCFFPGEKFIMMKSTEFSVDKEKIRFDDSLFLPDTDEIYLIKTTGGKFETKNLDLELTQSGVFVKATAENTNETIDVVTGLVESGVSLIGKVAAPLPAAAISAVDKNQLSEDEKNCLDRAEKEWDDIIDKANPANQVKLKDAKRRAFADTKTFKENYEEAKALKDKIFGLQGRRTDILNTTAAAATVPADTLKLIIQELDASIKKLRTTAFFGVTEKITWNASFRLNPRKPNLNASPTPDPGRMTMDLLTLSAEHGVCSVDVKQGTQLDPRFLIKKQCPNDAPSCRWSDLQDVACKGKKIRLKLESGEDGEGGFNGLTMAEKVLGVSLKEEGERGFYYRIPGRAIAYLYQGDDYAAGELGRAPVSIAQFGPIVSLPSSAGGRRTKYTLALYEASGGMKNFVMGSSALIQKSNIEDLTGAASTALETRGERKKAKQPKDELEQLEKQRKILEEKKKIRDLEKDLEPKPSNENP